MLFKEKKEIPDGIWRKCEKCGEILHIVQLKKNLWVCPFCSYHFRVNAKFYIEIIMDNGEFEELFENYLPSDPLEFPEYKEKVKKLQKETGLNDAAICGIGKIDGKRVGIFLTDFSFLAGSMGSVVGEKFKLIVDKVCEEKIPLIAITSSGGGARMQEGIISLMQMVKTCESVLKLYENKIPYVTILCDPTMAGVMASFAALGDISLAEPGALLGFTGPRVIQQTIGEKLPEGFQRSEFQLKHGMIDQVIDRRNLRETLIKILRILC